MTISELQRIRAPLIGGNDGPGALPRPRMTGSADFGTALRDAVGQVDASQKAADAQITAFVAGDQENVHEVMISMNQAKLSFQLLTEVRNKMLETYHELMRIQV
jgi:flagellar hook-basal body complex protein FliE